MSAKDLVFLPRPFIESTLRGLKIPHRGISLVEKCLQGKSTPPIEGRDPISVGIGGICDERGN